MKMKVENDLERSLESQLAANALSQKRSMNKWAVLAIVTLINMLAVGFPWTVMPVLFSSASKELHLSIAQIGTIWGMLPVGAAAVALAGGMLGDRIGFVKAVGIGCFAVAAANLLRGLSTSFLTMSATMFLTGATVAIIFPNLQKVGVVFFPPKQLGIATGIQVAGFAVGGVLTTALAGTALMSALGSWRSVLFLYSSFCVIMGVVWFIVMRGVAPGPVVSSRQSHTPSFGESIVAVFSRQGDLAPFYRQPRGRRQLHFA